MYQGAPERASWCAGDVAVAAVSTQETATVMGTFMKSGDAPDAHCAGGTFNVVTLTDASTPPKRLLTPSYDATYDTAVTTPAHEHSEAVLVNA